MKMLKYIVVMMTMLAVLLPCSHGFHVEMHDHDHDVAGGELAIEVDCECCSCDHEPCTDGDKVLVQGTVSSLIIYVPKASFVQYSHPVPKIVRTQNPFPMANNLAFIQTVQLLI